MPIITNNELMTVPGSHYQFSAVKPEHLEATEYTLVTIVVDTTGSVYDFASDLLKMIKETIKACQKNPRSENLMVRLTTFNSLITEEHGFKVLPDISPDDYKDLDCGGMTALYDASFEAIGATLVYAEKLSQNDFTVNGAIYIITDGADNDSRATPKMIIDLINKSKKAEVIESLITVLIGINTKACGQFLSDFQKEANLSQYVDMGDATPGKLAKLGGFISKSVSSQSQSLGSGGPSAPLTF